MSAETCRDVRARLSADADGGLSWLDDHLRDCEDCRTFAEALDAVRHHVPALVPRPPEELRGEVLEDLGAPASATAPRRRGGLLGASRRTVISLLAAFGGGVLGLLVVLLLAGPQPVADDAAERLAAVADHHGGRGTSHRFDMAGDLEVRLPPGPSTSGRSELTARLSRLGPGAELDAGAVLEVSFRAQGETDGRGALAYELRWRLRGPTAAGGVLEVVEVDDRTLLRRDGGRWVQTTEGAGFTLGVVELPHHLGEVLEELAAPVEAATMATVELGGEPVDHLRARTASGMVVDAWVGAEDDWLRRLRWLPAPPADQRDGTTHGEVVVRFGDHGRTRIVGIPDDVHDLDEVEDLERPPLLPELDP